MTSPSREHTRLQAGHLYAFCARGFPGIKGRIGLTTTIVSHPHVGQSLDGTDSVCARGVNISSVPSKSFWIVSSVS